jgi:hypothetical protein
MRLGMTVEHAGRQWIADWQSLIREKRDAPEMENWKLSLWYVLQLRFSQEAIAVPLPN